jgi:tetratricopeptide (TPR) repeat protein
MPDAQDLPHLLAQAIERLQADEHDVGAWRTLAQGQEQLRDWPAALNCHWAALQLSPARSDWLEDLKRVADRVGDPVLTEELLRKYAAATPGAAPGVKALAAFLRDQGRSDDAIAVLRQGVSQTPTPADLYNQLAAILAEDGRMDEALAAVEKAAAIAPQWPAALQNRANIRLALGDIDGALDDGAAAIAGAKGPEQASIRLARALALLSAGRLEEGWRAYGVRLEPDYGDSTRFDIPLPRWTPERPLAGARLLLVGEQGLGDEIMFANAVPDLLPLTERLALAVIPRLIPLFQRSFPAAEVTFHYTELSPDGVHRTVPGIDLSGYDAFAPMGDVLAALRPTARAFPPRVGYLAPDAERVAHWRRLLADLPPGPKIGLAWKSTNSRWGRGRYFAPFALWRVLFDRPDATIVCLQYGDLSQEVEEAARWGRQLWRPPGLDLRNDIEGVAALMAALDAVAGPLNGATTLAGAVGAPMSLVTVREAWQMLGAGSLPWFPQARVTTPQTPNAWREAIETAVAQL